MQPHHRGDVAAELQVWRLVAAQYIPQDLLDRVAAEGQLQLGCQHLEAGQGLLQRAVAPQQLQNGPVALAQLQPRGQGRAGNTVGLARGIGSSLAHLLAERLAQQLSIQHQAGRLQQGGGQGDQPRR